MAKMITLLVLSMLLKPNFSACIIALRHAPFHDPTLSFSMNTVSYIDYHPTRAQQGRAEGCCRVAPPRWDHNDYNLVRESHECHSVQSGAPVFSHVVVLRCWWAAALRNGNPPHLWDWWRRKGHCDNQYTAPHSPGSASVRETNQPAARVGGGVGTW